MHIYHLFIPKTWFHSHFYLLWKIAFHITIDGYVISGDNSINANVTVNTWRRDGPQHVEEGMFQPPVEKWQGDPPPYLNANVPPQHFDAWRGPPLNPPPGVWYRGPPGGPPYATPVGVGPGGFPMEPFPYYRPQIPPPALANSQPVPQGPGPRGHHPKNGDMYRPHIPDGYVRPGMHGLKLILQV